MKNLYNEIFKRKSFHLFRCNTYPINDIEINDIYKTYKEFDSLYPDIKTDIKILKKEETKVDRGQEYVIEIFSEKKDNYLLNIGYLAEQLDLYLVSKNIATLWYGIGKENNTYNGLDFVIMILISKVDESSFRKDMFKSKRKDLDLIWKGDEYCFSNIIRYAPSACNSQPWFVESNNNSLTIYRDKKAGKVGIMPIEKVSYYNMIDMGIFLCFLDLCLKYEKIKYSKELFIDDLNNKGLIKIAYYKLEV